MLATGCSTQRNTAKSRWWHAFNARYNTYYNGTQAYIEGALEKETGNRDNYTEQLPLYTVGNKGSRTLGKAHFDRTIDKCRKVIQQHSIKRRPQWNANRHKTARDLEWLSRREYNPFLWKAWLLMGKAQFQQGQFDEAASTFTYMSRLFRSQPAIYDKAQAWLARSFVEGGWLYDAEDVIRNMQRDSIHWTARREWNNTYADYYLHTGDNTRAIAYLQKVVKQEGRRKQRAREWFLLGQLFETDGRNAEAVQAYRKVSRLSPPYELDFNARVAITKVMAGTETRKAISRLRHMAASPNNKDYLDQVYYAIGNLYLASGDTLQAVQAYEQGAHEGTRSGVEKGVLLLKLGNLYWQCNRFADAQHCYNEALGLLDQDRADYQQVAERSKQLDELVPYIKVIAHQDSMQALAAMSETDRNVAIDQLIADRKKHDRTQTRAVTTAAPSPTTTATAAPGSSTAGTWYFYNQQLVAHGIETFRRQWGNRENTDDWQRSNKTVMPTLQDTAEQPTDTIPSTHTTTPTEQPATKTTDIYSRDYYMAQLPLTADQLSASNKRLADALLGSGVVFKDKMEMPKQSERALRRLAEQFPQFERQDEVYYHLFLLYARMGRRDQANLYLERLKKEHAQSQWTALVADPNYETNARHGEHIEDSLYTATYDAFVADRRQQALHNIAVAAKRFPDGANRDKFLFIGALYKLYDNRVDAGMADLDTVMKRSSGTRMGTMAGMILNGIKAGRQIHRTQLDTARQWQRHTAASSDSDSTRQVAFSMARDVPFVYLLVYHPDSVSENQLLFDLAKYNFTSYLVRNFDISITADEGLHRMMVAGFRNYDEALQYARQLRQQQSVSRHTARARSIIISQENLQLLGAQFSYNDYADFYQQQFVPLKVSTRQLLIDPVEITTAPPPVTQPSSKAATPKEQKAPKEQEFESDYYDLEGF